MKQLKDNEKIPYGRQYIDERDIAAVKNILKSDFLTQGPQVELFEKDISKKVSSKYAVAVNSATSALHISCLAVGLGKGDILWTVPNSFVASANCGLYCGAKVDFVDIDSKTWNISIESLKKKLLKAKKQKKLPKILIPVHLGGNPSNQQDIFELSKKYGFKIIEDASHSIGASNNGEPVGSCKWSDITIFSFHPVKIITTGEGGVATTNDKYLFKRLNLFRTHGITKNKSDFISKDTKEWFYEQHELGFNYRMTDIQAALGRSQLKKIDIFIKKRNQIASRYYEFLSGLPLKFQKIDKKIISSFHLFIIRLEEDVIISHEAFFKKLRNEGIMVNLHYIPIHLQPYYKQLGFKKGMFAESENYAESAISIPIYPKLSLSKQKFVSKSISKLLKNHG